jgi:aromatic-L-amino-acid decarboxylase
MKDSGGLDPGQLGLGDMDPEAFRLHAHAVVDWIADYLATVDRHPVTARVEPGEIRRKLPSEPPTTAEPMDRIFDDFKQQILPGITHWNHPGFLGYFGITGSGPGILGEMIAAALNVNAMLWSTSPAATELEEVVLDWLRQLLGLPPEFHGVINDTASSSSLYALAAAREAQDDLKIRQGGLGGRSNVPRLRMYASEEAHSSIEKAGIVLGIGQEGLRKISTDDAFRLDPAALDAAIKEDRARGWRPFAVVAVVGTTSTTSVDPVPAIAEICRREGLWLHVDAAYGGSAAIVPELRWVLDGCEEADSLVVNPHKWLFTPIDCSVLYTRRPDVLRAAFSLVPDYLQTAEGAGVRNLMDHGLALGRRFRALKLWFILRYFGRDGIVARLREHVRLAQQFARWIDDAPDFERLAPVPFSTVNFRYCPPNMGEPCEAEAEDRIDRLNERLEAAINATGRAFISHTRVRGRYALHVAVGNLRTTEEHLLRLRDLLVELGPKVEREVLGSAGRPRDTEAQRD